VEVMRRGERIVVLGADEAAHHHEHDRHETVRA